MAAIDSLVSSLRFMADAMLGHLARFLRLIGFDTAMPSNEWPDEVVLSKTLEEKRILLTRDWEFSKSARKKLAALNSSKSPEDQCCDIVYVSSQDTSIQLAEFFFYLENTFGADLNAFEIEIRKFREKLELHGDNSNDVAPIFKSRCSKCNWELESIEKKYVSDIVPPMALQYHSKFWRCTNPNCAAVYWVGSSHWKHIVEFILRSLEALPAIREKITEKNHILS